MLRDFLVIVLFSVVTIVLYNIYNNERYNMSENNRGLLGILAFIFFLISAILGIRFIIHLFVAIGKVW